jgi:hypothetical protein
MEYLLMVVLLVSANALAEDAVLDQCVSDSGHATYRTFQTKNIWTFLKLDTRSGMVWQVQWGDHAATVPVNSQSLVAKRDAHSGRFTLCPTRNIFNFMLLDQDDGRMWSVQWSLDDKGRSINPLFFVDPTEITPPK